ncbi:uncharacterized protein LOC141818267 [Curcuma longa]|uniref:uncharacterized protein LOC141818267 n=1 Tax=Curcuma longa TaxID=136217 RepID=UPI003D9E5324
MPRGLPRGFSIFSPPSPHPLPQNPEIFSLFVKNPFPPSAKTQISAPSPSDERSSSDERKSSPPAFFPLFLPLPNRTEPSSLPLHAENPNPRLFLLLLLRQQSPPDLFLLLLRQQSPRRSSSSDERRPLPKRRSLRFPSFAAENAGDTLKMPKYYTTNTPKCRCGLLAKIITSWTDDNPGRRFAICSLHENEGGCGFWTWIDDEICSRSTQVIPGLLRRINKLEADAKSAENTMKELKTENDKLEAELDKTKKIIRHIFVVIMCWIIWVVIHAVVVSSD